MKSRYFILFDTEYTAWEGSQERNWSYDYEYKELICISALKINNKNNKLNIVDKFNCYIKPTINPLLSDYIINLTGITQNTIDIHGISFKNAIKKFYKFCNTNKIYSYGNDYNEIKINLELNNISSLSIYYKWECKFFDIRTIFELYNINTNKYSSGTIYKSVKLIPDKKINIHDSQWDTYSLFITLKYLLDNIKFNNLNIIVKYIYF